VTNRSINAQVYSAEEFDLEMVSPHRILIVDVDVLSTASTLALRTLIQLNPGGYAKYIHLLAQSLGEIHSSPARAEIIWLVGEYAGQLNGRAADVLRLSLQDFAEQVYVPPF
jgi:AP-3 complex subunit beta